MLTARIEVSEGSDAVTGEVGFSAETDFGAVAAREGCRCCERGDCEGGDEERRGSLEEHGDG